MEAAQVRAGKKNLTAYEACYVVLVERFNLTLLTADESPAHAIELAILIRDFEITPCAEE